MMESKSLKVSWIIIAIIQCFHIIAGLIAIIFPQVFVANKFQLMTNQQWSAFMASSPQISSFISIISSAEGLFVFTSALAYLFIILFAYRKGERWAWYIVLVITTIGHIGSIVENIYIGDMGIVIINIITLVISYGALALAAKAMLKKGSA